MRRMWRAFFFLTLALACLAVWGIHIYVEREQQFRHHIETGVKTTSELTISSLVEWRRRVHAAADAISDDELLAQAVKQWRSASDAQSEAPIAARLRSLVERGGFTKATLLTLQGEVLLTSGDGQIQVTAREMQALNTALDSAQAVFVEPYDDNTHFAYPSFSVLAPMFVDNESVGVMWLTIDLRASLFPLLNLWRAASMTSENLLLQRDGDAVIHINPLRYHGADALGKFADISAVQFVAVKAFHGLRGVAYDIDYRYQPVLAVVGTVPDSPWILVSKIDEAEAFAQEQRSDGLLLGLSVGLVILVFCAMAFFLIWRLARQERRLKMDMQRNMRWLDRAQKTAALGIFSIDLKNREVTLSEISANIFGFPEKVNISLKKFKSMVHKKDVNLFIREKMKIEENFQTSFRIFPNDGTHPKWIDVWCEYDATGDEKKLIGTIQDISLRKKVEEEKESYRLSLEDQVRKDSLTGLWNRFALSENIHTEWLRARRSQQEISLLMVDVDYFKGYNDFYGHLDGDECLQRVSHKIMETVARTEDFVARYGGEEFAVLLPNTGSKAAQRMAEKIRVAVEKMQIEHLASPEYKRVTVSIGVASAAPVFLADASQQEEVVRHFFENADSALYAAKHQGRNCVSVFVEKMK